jgi:UDP-N-acetyl-D-mannosaminuronic acid dehydrogenase
MNIKSDNSVCIIGLGFVGLTLAVVMANKGFKVYGVEKNKSILNSLKKKQAHFYEPGLKENLKKIIKKKNFLFFNKIPIIKSISTYIITVGTPLDSKKKLLHILFLKQLTRFQVF